MDIILCTLEDFDQITADIVDFWGSDRTLYLHNPFLIHEFGNTAYVVKQNGLVLAYLFGFFSQTGNVAYVHLLGVREAFQRQGLGLSLYQNFMDFAQSKGVAKVKAITSPTNQKSISFHKKKIGMTLLGSPNEDGINVVKNYSGKDKDRVVFEKYLL
jgi:predicted GNAT superfamily acetyltransferase